jgi:hypothetical protein
MASTSIMILGSMLGVLMVTALAAYRSTDVCGYLGYEEDASFECNSYFGVSVLGVLTAMLLCGFLAMTAMRPGGLSSMFGGMGGMGYGGFGGGYGGYGGGYGGYGGYY